jgi:predicted nucleic acid-binding protein
MRYIVDTNIFLRLAKRGDPQRPAAINALRILRARREDLCYTPQVLNEFWSVCTRPAMARGGLGLTVVQTERKAKLIEKYYRLLPDNLDTHQTWRRLVAAHSVMGVGVYDARLAASMDVYRVGYILTFNTRDFGRFAGITAVDPKDIQ